MRGLIRESIATGVITAAGIHITAVVVRAIESGSMSNAFPFLG